MIETGVNITANDNGVSSTAQRISNELEQIAQSADNINSSFDPEEMNNYNKELSEVARQLGNLFQFRQRENEQNEERRQQQREEREQRQQERARIKSEREEELLLENRYSRAQGIVSGTGSALVQAGRGDVAGAGLSAGRSLATMLGGTAGMIGMIGLAGGVATNALAEGYQARTPQALRLTALQDRFTGDMDENTRQLRQVMGETVDSVAKYGKTYAEGAAAQEAFLTAGGTDFTGSRAGAFSLMYGADINQLAAFTGQTQRYGQRGGLNITRALLESQGLGAGQFTEVLSGIQDQFTTLLSSGIIKPLEEIAASQAFFSQAGPTFQGGLGAQRLAQINQATAGAASLRSRDDIFLYRAAQQLEGGSILETRKRLEEGMDEELFRGLLQEYERFGLGRTESIIKLADQFGLSTTAAEQLYGLKDAPGADISSIISQGTAEPAGTKETEYIEALENITQTISETFGAEAFDLRAGAVGMGASITEGLKGVFTDIGDSVKAEKIIADTMEVKNVRVTENIASDAFQAEIYQPASSLAGVKSGFQDFVDMITKAREAGVSETDLYSGLRSGYSEFTKRGSDKGTALSKNELQILQETLDRLIEATNGTTDAIKNTPITVQFDGRGVPTGL